MLARCSKCRSTFVTEVFGRQKCPVCSAEVVIRDPNAVLEATPVESASGPSEAASGGNPAGSATSPSAARRGDPAGVDDLGRTPWDRRDTLGTAQALKQTIAVLVTDPALFFERLGRGGGELLGHTLLWFVLTAILPTAIASMVSLATTDFAAQYEEMRAAYTQLGLPFDADGTLKMWFSLLDRPEAAPAIFLFEFVILPVILYVLAGLTQLALFMTGGAKRSFDATLRGYAYAFTPSLLAVIPVCGGLISFFWTVALQYLAVHRIHDTGAGRTVFAGFLLPMVLLICGMTIVAVLVGGLLGGIAG